ncbi:cyclin-domain-containing protein [Gonapodya prolifera JEL478]|uniref:Cyclin-domain-containing protein n=1 Tax=Gonapodya prolifera (strain JEL478) TaxID=1344416 RepID=A0A139AVB8_GONPJ|nr:cyclin-domain-containing protein [Gonapodya prolifera JEL478]|eukprot:KXS20523.1 cyclin-domain-containing protein [Gonapodya prolifera JEL478]
MEVDQISQPPPASQPISNSDSSNQSPRPSPVRSPNQNVALIEVPATFSDCEEEQLVNVISDMLTKLTVFNDKIKVTSSNLTRFHSRQAPPITIGEYLKRCVKYASLERPVLLMLLVYIDRVCERHRGFVVSSLTVHRFIITALTVGSKTLCDSFCTNSLYARVGGISTKELNTLELEFLFLIDWQLSIESELLQQYYVNLMRQSGVYRVKRS